MKERPDATLGGRLLGGCALLLLCGGVALLAPAALRLARPAHSSPTPAAAATAPANDVATAGRPPEGKRLPTLSPATPSAYGAIPPSITQAQPPARATSDIDALYDTIAPVHDYFIAARELGRLDLGARSVSSPPARVGDRATFQTADGPRQAELIYADDLASYWVETGLTLDRDAIAAAAERLRAGYYPLLADRFGREWQPGVDADPRVTVLHTLGAADRSEMGYFIDENEYPQTLFPRSNEREMIYLNMAQLEPGTPLYDGTLVHEMQHLIQWNLDANEDKWLNEGLSQVTEALVGLDTVDPQPYLERTHIRLDRWDEAASEIYAHYAAAYLYNLYFWEQLGDAALSELARHPANGLAAIRAVLAGHRPDLSFEELTADWATALYLDGRTNDPRFNVRRHDLSPPFYANRVRQLPFESTTMLEQFAVDYIDLDFSGPATLTFVGDTIAPLIDAPPGGEAFWFAPGGNSSRTQLTATVNLAGLTDPALWFHVRHDLEAGYDFAYLSVSTDGGQTWRLLEPNHAVPGAYGPAWGGRSADASEQANGWLEERISLATYAGQSVLLRFDVVTDFETAGRGFAVSAPVVSPAFAPVDWTPDGFVETGHLLPQRWAVRLIRDGASPEVIALSPDEFNRAQATIELGPEGGALLVTPLTPFTEEAADYWLSVSR